jgi:hypothetical protein
LSGTAEGTFGVDDPAPAVEAIGEAREGVRVGELGTGAAKIELSLAVGALEVGEELAAEERREDFDGEEMAVAGRRPLRAVERDATAGDDAMQVGVELQVAGPGVQHGRDAGDGAETGGVAPQGEERPGSGAEQNCEDQPSVAEGERAQGGRQGEDDVEVVGVEDARHAPLDPARLAQALALGAVTVTAGVVGRALVAAGRAGVEVSAEGWGAADLDGANDRALFARERVLAAVGLAVGAKDGCDLERRTRRGLTGAAAQVARHGGSVGVRAGQGVERTAHGADVAPRDERVADGGANRAVAEQSLDHADVGAGLEQVRGKAVPHRVRRDVLGRDSGTLTTKAITRG